MLPSIVFVAFNFAIVLKPKANISRGEPIEALRIIMAIKLPLKVATILGSCVYVTRFAYPDFKLHVSMACEPQQLII
jgi:hypothetical protein